jgi:hypothetical protein
MAFVNQDIRNATANADLPLFLWFDASENLQNSVGAWFLNTQTRFWNLGPDQFELPAVHDFADQDSRDDRLHKDDGRERC